MSISIHEALQLPTMSQTNLIGGRGGLHNTIKWVTIVEVIEDINRLQEGEFLITTGYGLEDYKDEFHKLLSMNKLAGVAIYTSFYISEIPASFIQLADQHHLPLIEIPTDINFSTITKEILQQILNKQMEVTFFSLEIHKKLTGLVLQNKGKKFIIETLGELIDSSIFILDEEHSCMYEFLSRKELSFSEGYLYHSGSAYPASDYLAGDQNSFVQRTIDTKIVMSFPIIANETTFGYILAVKEQEHWSEFDEVAIEHAATVFALEFLKKEAVEAAQIGMRGEFLEDVFNKNFKDRLTAIEEGRKMGYDLTTKQSVLFMTFTESAPIEPLYQFARRFFNLKKIQHLIRVKRSELFILFECNAGNESEQEHCQKLGAELQEQWSKVNSSAILIGIGRPYDDIYLLGKSAQEASYAVHFSPLLFRSKTVIHYNDLGAFHFLIDLKEQGLNLKDFYIEVLRPLISQKKQGLDFIHTLEVYFKNDQSIQVTSAELYIHRHTLKYRLNQIQKKTGLSLDSPDEKLKLQLSVLAYKLDKHFEQLNKRKPSWS